MRALLTATVTTAGATVVGQVLVLITNKILAQTLGVAGIGFYSLLRQIQDAGTAAGTLSVGGLVQGLAARQGAARGRLYAAAGLIALPSGVAVVALLLLAPEAIAFHLFDATDANAVMAVVLCVPAVALGILYGLLNPALNAMRAINAMMLLSVGGGVATALLAFPVASLAIELPQALAVLIGVPLLLQVAAMLIVLQRLGWWRSLRDEDESAGASAGGMRPGAAEFRYFAGFFGLNVTLTALNLATMLALRAAIVHDQGLAGAGLFAAAWGLGGQSLGLVLSSFGVYVLPTLAAAAVHERGRHLQDAATLVIGASLPLVVGLLAFKPLVVSLLFSREFLPAIALLQILLIGNYLKALSWVMASPMLATADLRPYFVIEAGWFVVFAAIALVGIDRDLGLPIVGVAFVAAYVCHLAASAAMARRRFGFVMNRRSALLFLGGGLLIAATAAATWNQQSTDWMLALPATAAACVMALFGLTPPQRGKLFALLPWRRGA